MDTVLIDVVIGLVLVFAMTSLLATTLQEAYSSMTKMRGRVLRQAIVSFVGDDPRLAKALLDHPLLASLSPQMQAQASARLPSWIEADTLVSALVGHLVDTHAGGQRPDTPAELVQRIQDVARGNVEPGTALAPVVGTQGLAGADAALPNPLFVRGLSSLLQGAERDWPTFEKRLAAWYGAVGERSTGWFKRRTQLGAFFIGLGVAAMLNINPIIIGSQLWVDEPLRKALVDTAEKVDNERRTQSEAAPKPVASARASAVEPVPAAGQGVTPAAAASAVMDRLTLALRAQVTDALGDAAREQVLKPLAEQLVELQKAVQGWQAAGAVAGQATARRMDELARAFVAAVPPRPELAAVHETAQQFATLTKRVAEPAQIVSEASPTGKCAAPTLNDEEKALCGQLQSMAKLQQLGLPIGWSGSAVPSLYRSGCESPDECKAVWRQWADWGLMPFGWVLMGLACTLGAPFWFDALSRIIRLRGSGDRGAAGTSAAGGGTPPSTLATPASPAPPSTGAVGTAMSDALNDHERALTPAEVQRVQRGLGMPEVEVSGWFDGPTRQAIKAWQERAQAPATGELSAWQVRQLLEMRPSGAATAASAGTAGSAGALAVAAAPAAVDDGRGDHGDGCVVGIVEPTPDEALPPARGGVQPGKDD
ncbi:MAG: peptidoglycan-binding domain-containing protein [Burkholderiaceae bacterium]